MQCHDDEIPEMHDYPITGKVGKDRQSWSPHAGLNLTHPDKSGLLMAPLSKAAGGWGICNSEETDGPSGVIQNKTDPTYQAILAHIQEGQKVLNTIKRWDMPGFKPNPFYIREMKRFGVLTEEYDREKDTIDVFALDKKYFEMHWYYPDQADLPPLFENNKFHETFKAGERKRSHAVNKPKQPAGPVVDGLYEAEAENHVSLTGKSADRAQAQGMGGWGNAWSNGEQVLWRCRDATEELIISFEVKQPGKTLRLGLTKAPDYGIFEFYLDDTKIGAPVDLYDPKVLRADDIDIENVTITTGKHQMKIKCIGKSEKSKSYLFGIDYLQVVK